MKKVILISLLAFLYLFFPQESRSQSKSDVTKEVIQGEFVHTVLIWLKNPENKKDRDFFEKSMKKFIDASKYVKSAHLGVPADTPRDIVDNSYTYCLIVTFDSRKAQDLYQEEQVHKDFIAECKELWDKILIYDSINIWK